MSNGVLQGKKYEVQLSTTKLNSLTPAERRIYSFLIYRQKRDQGATRQQIAKRCRVSRNCPLNHLARFENRKWYPRDTTAEWWAWKKNGGHASWRLFTPSAKCPLSESINSIYWLLVSLSRQTGYIKYQRVSGLAVLSGYSRRQVFKALKVLSQYNLIVRTHDYLIVNTPADLSWWVDRKKKTTLVPDTIFKLSERLKLGSCQDPKTDGYLKSSLDRAGIAALNRGLAAEEVDAFFFHVIRSIKIASRITEYCMSVCETHLRLLKQSKYDKLAFLTTVFNNWNKEHAWQGI